MKFSFGTSFSQAKGSVASGPLIESSAPTTAPKE